MQASCEENVTAVWEWRQNPSEGVDQFIGSILVNAGPPFRGHAELLGVVFMPSHMVPKTT